MEDLNRALAPMSEAKNPGRDAAFALFVALVCLHRRSMPWCSGWWSECLGPGATTDRPLAEVARITMGNRGAALVAIGALVSVYGYLSAKMLGMPRVTFALAEGGDLPRLFAAVSSRFHTPWFSILFYAVAVWGLAIVGSFTWNVTLSVVARLFYYAVVCAALIVLRRQKAASPAVFRLPGGPVLAVLGDWNCGCSGDPGGFEQVTDSGGNRRGGLLNWLWARRADRRKLTSGLSSPVIASPRMKFRTLVLFLLLCSNSFLAAQNSPPANFHGGKQRCRPHARRSRLARGCFRPSDGDGKFPVLVYRTPYGKDAAQEEYTTFRHAVERGYAVVVRRCARTLSFGWRIPSV